jgi:hypothetical protein
MAEIFLSSANEDRETAFKVAALLESAGWTVWWDRRIPAGCTWRSVIEGALNEMRCMVVLWSTNSIVSDWVKEEAEEARLVQKLVPVLIEPVKPPVRFRAIQAADLIGWDGSSDALGARGLIGDLESRLGKPVKPVEGKSSESLQSKSHAIDASSERNVISQYDLLVAEPVPQSTNEITEPQVRTEMVAGSGRVNWKIAAGSAALIVLFGVFWFRPRQVPPIPQAAVEKVEIQSAPAAPSLLKLAVNAERSELKPGETLKVVLKGEYSDGTSGQIDGPVGWSTTESKVARVNDGGQVSAIQPGVARIFARHGVLISNNWIITVVKPDPPLKARPETKPSKLLTSAVKTQEPVVQRYSEPIPVTPPPVEQLRQRIGPYLNRAREYRTTGNYAAALAELERDRAIDPSSAEIRQESEQTRRACNAEKYLGQSVNC